MLNIEGIREYCLAKENIKECLPFGEETLVFKVLGKMFALIDLNVDFGINLKCDPERAIELRKQYIAITPGYHMNKKHWNTITPDSSISDILLLELIDHSYAEVLKKIPTKRKGSISKQKHERAKK